jgi:hypothetical protein
MTTRLFALLAVLLCCSHGHAEEKDTSKPDGQVAAAADETVTIPLSEIWALDIPGTKDILKLENREKFRGMKVADLIKNSLVENTKSVLSSRHWPARGQSAGGGFVVVGTGLEALKEANAVLVKKKERPDTLPAGKELTLVFYSYMSGRYVRLDRVVKSNRDIKIE